MENEVFIEVRSLLPTWHISLIEKATLDKSSTTTFCVLLTFMHVYVLHLVFAKIEGKIDNNNLYNYVNRFILWFLCVS